MNSHERRPAGGKMESGSNTKKTKLVCTLGPASEDVEVLRKMSESGMDVVRINSGHSELEEIPGYIKMTRKAGEAANRRIGVMLDLQGPRLRVGQIDGGSAELDAGQEFTISSVPRVGDRTGVHVAYDGLSNDLRPGQSVLMDDGLIRMRVKDVAAPDVKCEVLEGGHLLQGKGMNFPDSRLDLAAFTDRDRVYLEAGLAGGIDWVAQSFVRTAADVQDLLQAMEGLGKRVPVMAKIEKSEAVDNIDEILQTADGIMVARGDLGVEMETEEVPMVQKELIDKAVHSALPVVTATQMLESMVHKPRPTRAEASDVANAILDGSDALMLSAETAIGEYPVQCVEMMARIAAKVEQAIDYVGILESRSRWSNRGVADSIGYAACKIAADLKARAIITMTRSGYTARLISRYRPQSRVIAASPNDRVVDSISLLWGVEAVKVPRSNQLKVMIEEAINACARECLVMRGDLVVVTGGFFDEESSKTNVVHVHTVR
jgi:pyruvate kinase